MALYTQLKQDLKKKFPFVQSALNEGASKGAALLGTFTKQINGYEKRVKTLAREIDTRKREARDMGKERLDRFVTQLRDTRSHLEDTVVGLVQDERKKLNQRLDDLLGFLNKTDKKTAKTMTAKSNGTRRSTATKRKTTTKKKATARTK